MRIISKAEKKKRGCVECYDLVQYIGRNCRVACPYDECPYHELDKYDTYSAYLKANGALSVDKLLKKSRRSVTVSDNFPPRVKCWR